MCKHTRGRPPEEPLDYSPSSGAIDSHEKESEVLHEQPYSWSQNHTTIGEPYDDSTEPLSRADIDPENEDRYNNLTWERLNELNRRRNRDNNEDPTSRRDDNRERARYNDFLTITDNVDGLVDHEQSELRRLSMELYQYHRTTREDGFQFGGAWPIEVVEITLVTMAARRLVDIDTFDERDMDKGLHNVAFDGEQVQHLCDTFVPRDKEIDTTTIRSCRAELRNR